MKHFFIEFLTGVAIGLVFLTALWMFYITTFWMIFH